MAKEEEKITSKKVGRNRRVIEFSEANSSFNNNSKSNNKLHYNLNSAIIAASVENESESSKSCNAKCREDDVL